MICKISFRTIPRYGKATLLMLFLGFLFLITTANSYGVLRQELDAPYVLTGTAAGQTDLEQYLHTAGIEAVTPVLSFESRLTAEDATLSGTINAVLAEYLDVSFTQGNTFQNDTNMPFLVMNQYASRNFLNESQNRITLTAGDTVSMTIGEEEQAAILCGIFEDELEQPVIYMSYPLASRLLSKGDHITLLFRLEKTEDLENAAKSLKKLGVDVSCDESLPELWKLTKQQIFQSFLSALVLLVASSVQMAQLHKREQQDARPQWHALALTGLEKRQLRWIFPLRTAFAGAACLACAIATAGILGSLSPSGLLASSIGLVTSLAIVTWGHRMTLFR